MVFPRHGRRWFLLGLLLLLLPGGFARPVLAAEMVRFVESARALGMGGAMTAVAEGFDAMVYNPAGLAFAKRWHVAFRAWDERSVDSDTGSGVAFFRSLQNQGGQPTADVDAFLSQTGAIPHTRRSLNFVGYHNARGFGVAHFETIRLHSEFDASAGTPTIHYDYDRLTGEILTFAYPSKWKLVSWGFSLKYLQREGNSRSLTSAELVDPAFDLYSKLDGLEPEYAADIGIIARLPVAFLRPTVAVAMLNAGSPDFHTTGLEPIREEINVGLALMPDVFSQYGRLTISMDMRDVTRSAFPDEEGEKREHYGAEFAFLQQSSGDWLVSLRAGSSQGGDSWGAGLHLNRNFSVDLAVYNENLGTATSPVHQERWLLEVKLGF